MRANHGKISKCFWIMGLVLFLFSTGVILISCNSLPFPTSKAEPTVTATPPDSGDVTVNITNEELKEYQNIVVRVLDTNMVDTKKDDGQLLLGSCGSGQYITAWASGYYIAIQQCNTGQKEYNITLGKYQVDDNANYTWVEAHYTGQARSCEPCHIGNDPNHLEYLEWQQDGHSSVFKNSYFWTTYLGTDIARNPSPTTRWTITDNSKHTRIMPDHSQPYYGPGFKTDYPTDNGTCAFCHVPASVSGPQIEVDLTGIINASLSGQHSAATEGITCDVCHKVLNVKLDSNNRPFPDKPGVLSFDFIREDSSANRLYAGPLTSTEPNGVTNDINTDIKVTCSPVFSESQFCAPCHYGQFWGTQIYNAYGEWLESPYANSGKEDEYKTCQACHMMVNNGAADMNAADRNACAENRVLPEDFNHNMLQTDGNNFPLLIQDAAKIKMEAQKADENIELTVHVTNTKAGHKFPTDSPMRHLILLVEVRDKFETLLPQIDGPTIPAWGGTGNQTGDYAGRPGQIYANILMDLDTNQAPTIAYWNPTTPAWKGSDTRLKPNEPRTSKYTFAMPANGHAVITVKLIYRYAFIEIARQKGWTLNDIVVTQETAEMH